MFEAWGHIIHRRRRLVLAISGAVLVASVVVLFTGGRITVPVVHGTESERGVAWMRDDMREPPGARLTVVFSHRTLEVDAPEFRDAVERITNRLRRDPHVAFVRTPFELPALMAGAFVSPDRHHVVVMATVRHDLGTARAYYDSLRRSLDGGTLEVHVSGPLQFMHDLDRSLARDLQRGEFISIPLALIVLLLVFGSLVAAAVPVGVGGLAVAGAVAGVLLLSRGIDVTQYCLNVVTLVGTSVAIDYSLFMVSRFRDELADGRDVETAVARTMATAGRAVLFSGLAVGIGLAGLLFYRGTHLQALGLAGTLVVTLAVIYAMTFVPALLSALGPRIDALRVRRASVRADGGLWRRVATAVMRRPLLVLLPSLAFTIVLAVPFVRLRMVMASADMLPRAAESRRANDLLREHFPRLAANRVVALARFPGSPLTPDHVRESFGYSRRLASLPGVERVDSPVDLDDSLDAEGYAQLHALPADARPPGMDDVMRELAGSHTVLFAVSTSHANGTDAVRALVDRVRAVPGPRGAEIAVTGVAAIDLDNLRTFRRLTPYAIGFILCATLVILFALLRSVLLPLKAVAMNFLSIGASFGALVWVFQDGHLAHWLRFEPGPIEPTLPVVLFCAVFGLSMDYEVLMLSRMKEEFDRTGDNTQAVADGLERTGRLITSAAAIMVAVFVAFAMADVVFLKAMGIGMAIAVTLDATIVRVLIVPATMRLLGRWNWWAPGRAR